MSLDSELSTSLSGASITSFDSRSSVSSIDEEPIVVLTSDRAVISGRLTPATIVVSTNSGKIVSVHDTVLPELHFPPGTQYKNYNPHILIPGLVDAHVHLNEPGRTEWEGFHTGTQAAAFGGVTTVIDMPLNAIPPTTTVENLNEKIHAAQGKCWVDVGFYGGIIPGNSSELKGLVEAGVRGFKGFMIDSGVEEFPAVSSHDITQAMLELADEPTILMFHAEMISPISDSVSDDVQRSLPPLSPSGPLDAYSTFLSSRPPSFETYAISQILSLAPTAPNLPLHIVHLSALEAIPLLRQARSNGIKITAETCFHYLSLAAEGIADGDTRHKCCPPIRGKSNQDRLWEELQRHPADESVIQTVVSDHSPCTPDLKLLPQALSNSEPTSTPSSQHVIGDFFSAWGGVSSVGLGLSILWTEGLKRFPNRSRSTKPDPATKPSATTGIHFIEDIVRWCSTNTAEQVGLGHRKGDLAVGMDADIAVFDADAEWIVEPSTMLFRNKCSPYQGKKLRGVVRETWVRGRKVFERGEREMERDGRGGGRFVGKEPTGELLLERRTRA